MKYFVLVFKDFFIFYTCNVLQAG